MKHPFNVPTLFALILVLAVPALAQSHDGHTCPHQNADLASLRTCVQHAADQGFIDNAGITQSLLAKLASAESAISRGQPQAAINVLEAFIAELEAQAGRHIQAEHARHLVAHARLIIETLAP